MEIWRYFSEYGVAVAAIAALVYVVRLFTHITSNHIDHNTEASGLLRDSNNKLVSAVEQLLEWLKHNYEK